MISSHLRDVLLFDMGPDAADHCEAMSAQYGSSLRMVRETLNLDPQGLWALTYLEIHRPRHLRALLAEHDSSGEVRILAGLIRELVNPQPASSHHEQTPVS